MIILIFGPPFQVFLMIFAIFQDFKPMVLHDYLVDFKKFAYKTYLHVEINRLRMVSQQFVKNKNYFQHVIFQQISLFIKHGYAPPHDIEGTARRMVGG